MKQELELEIFWNILKNKKGRVHYTEFLKIGDLKYQEEYDQLKTSMYFLYDNWEILKNKKNKKLIRKIKDICLKLQILYNDDDFYIKLDEWIRTRLLYLKNECLMEGNYVKGV